MRWLTPLLCLFLGMSSSMAQPDAGALSGYSKMRIEKGPRVTASFGDSLAIEEMTGGVRIELLSDDPSLESLPIRAFSIRFQYREGSDMPSVITLEGNVEVRHPQASVTAQKAVWNFDTGALVFTGNPVMDSDTVKGLSGSSIVLNFNENTLEVKDLVADQVPLSGAGAAPDPSLLAGADVRDWPGFIDTIKAQLKEEGANPGKQLAAKLNPELRGYLEKLSTAVLAEQKDALLEEINEVIAKPGLYSREAWAGTPLNDEAKALLSKGTLGPKEQSRQNRLLLEAAYPSHIGSV